MLKKAVDIKLKVVFYIDAALNKAGASSQAYNIDKDWEQRFHPAMYSKTTGNKDM